MEHRVDFVLHKLQLVFLYSAVVDGIRPVVKLGHVIFVADVIFALLEITSQVSFPGHSHLVDDCFTQRAKVLDPVLQKADARTWYHMLHAHGRIR